MDSAEGRSARHPVPAAAVAAALRERLPGLGTTALHKLLYYCQGHHLAALGRPLFRESVSAWDMGPVVSRLWHAEKDGDTAPGDAGLDEAELNTIGYVVSRYGGLSAGELIERTHAESPWAVADERREPGGSAPIPNAALEAYFRAVPPVDDDRAWPSPAAVAPLLAGAESRRTGPRRFDDLAALRRRLAGSG